MATVPAAVEPDQIVRLHILLSYHYYKTTDLDKFVEENFDEPYPGIMADSGAFTAMTSGGEVTLAEYAGWIQRWQHRFDAYANLDVIKDAEGTLTNQRILEDEYGLQPLPVFHVLEDWKYLDHYLENYHYVGLGVAGMQARKDAVMRWLVKCFKRRVGTDTEYHGFGLTGWPVMRSFPWLSVDSSSWGQGFRYGAIPLFDARQGRFMKAKLGDPISCAKHAHLFKQYGYDPADFADRARNDREKICGVSALSYLHAEQWINARRNGKKKLTVHLVDTHWEHLVFANRGIHRQ